MLGAIAGSGKTTCLRLIAGFEQLSGGPVHIFGQPASELPPWQRDVNTVFQDYALFPHMSILDNVAYGLMVKGMAKKARHARAQEALEKVALGFAHHRKPSQLSGGQRQRVAIARALVNQPRVLLLDEPLGALDLKLREQMQVELKKLQQSLGITFIFVTHDQSEALSMSDRVAVFNNGRIEQVDAPQDLYLHPRTAFVAGFVGTANVFCSRGGLLTIVRDGGQLVAASGACSPAGRRRGAGAGCGAGGAGVGGGDADRAPPRGWRQTAGQPGQHRWRGGGQRSANRGNSTGVMVALGDDSAGKRRLR